MFGVGVGVRVGGFTASSGVAPYVGLLDTYPNAAAAYSVRLLRGGYTGNAIRVRRSGDNAEFDFGFDSNGNLNTSSLTSFCIAGGGTQNGFVTTWYDQSGNGRNATQTTAVNQPQIVSSGSVISENSKSTISFLSGLSGLDFSTFYVNSATMFMIVKAKNDPPTAENSGFVSFGSSGNANHFPWISGDIYDNSFSSTRYNLGNPTTGLNQLNLYNVLSTSTQWTARLNSNQIYTTSSNTAQINANPKIGSNNASYGMDNFITELIIYASDQSSNLTGIENNINSFYSIY